MHLNKTKPLIAALVLMFITVSGASAAPVIEGHGRMVPLPNAAEQPDVSAQYKAVFDVTGNSDDKSVNGGLDHVARAVNVFASAGVPLDHLHFVAVIHGQATPIVLDNAHYKEKFGVDNPNIDIMQKLAAAGVKLEVCGQAIHGMHIDESWVFKPVTVTLSGLSDLVIYGNRGYAYIGL